jgi:hypothetical protein
MMQHSKIIFKDRLRGRKISLKKGLEIIYQLPFTGFIRSDKFWWWRNYIDWIKYLKIEYPSEGCLMIVRLNHESKDPNTIRVVTTGSLDKRKPQVLKKIFRKEL